MSTLVVLAGVAIVSPTALAVTGTAAAAEPSERPDPAEQSALRADLLQASDGHARFVTRPETGQVSLVAASATHPLLTAADDEATTARAFVDGYGALFGIDEPRATLVAGEPDDIGAGSVVRFTQRVDGAPVLAGQIAVRLDAAGAVVSAAGETADVPADLDTDPSVPSAEAEATALALTARTDGAPADQLRVSTAQLTVFDPTLIDAPATGTRLVWSVEVRTDLGDVDRLVLVDAHDGTVVFHFSPRAEALDREVCDNADNAALDETCVAPVRSEGGPASGVADVNDAYDFSGDTYNFYSTILGRDSLDDAGMTLRSTVRYCPGVVDCPYANAFWNGEQMVYGAGYASADDVVGHELTHGVTEFSSGLIYYSESGAINESLSDVFGELIDLWNGADASGDRWLMGEDLPDGGAIRDMEAPGSFSDPDRMTSPQFYGGLDDNRGVHSNSGVNNRAAALMTDGGTFNGQTVTGLGITRVAHIYYEAQTALLTPGSDYQDLGVILPQACQNLVGTAGISAADCQEVSEVVLATEMHLRPSSPGANQTAAVCPSGTQNSVVFADDMETSSAAWSSSTTGGGAPWAYTTDASQSGTRSLHVVDAAAPKGISTLTLATPLAIPAGSTAFLRFEHLFATDSDSAALYDGGVLEYSTNGGSSWSDITTAGSMVHGYDDVIDNSSFGGQVNDLAGRQAFGTISPSFRETRANLSSLAGQTIRLRFRFATDNYPALEFPGWFIDDVSVYTCGVVAAPGPARNVSAAPGGSSGTASVSWSPPLSDGGSPIIDYVVTPVVGGVTQTPTVVSAATTNVALTALTPGASATASVAARNAIGTGTAASSGAFTVPGTPTGGGTSIVALSPSRVLDTRTGQATADGQFNGIGRRDPGSVTAVTVGGRVGVPTDAQAVALNVTVTETSVPGFLTVYPCGATPPTASNLNYGTGTTVPNLVITRVGAGGQVCFFTQSGVHLLADVNGYVPAGAGFTAVDPARLYESRSGESTVDGLQNGTGLRPTGTITEVQVTGRAGIPTDATTVSLNVTVTGAQAAGFLTVFPCGAGLPTASNLNYVAGATVPNAVMTRVGDGGRVCVFNQAPLHLVVDVSGYAGASSGIVTTTPARLLDTRSGQSTVDGQFNGIGRRGIGSVTEVQVSGRAGVPAGAQSVVLNATVTESAASGFATVYPCGGAPPNASNLNYGTGTTIANAVVTRLSPSGTVCVFTQSATHLVLDVTASIPG